MDAAECIASALRNLYRRLEARRATLTDLLLLLLGARITVHLFSVAAQRTARPSAIPIDRAWPTMFQR